MFSDVPADTESLFENKNLREFAPSTVMGRNVGINDKGIYS